MYIPYTNELYQRQETLLRQTKLKAKLAEIRLRKASASPRQFSHLKYNPKKRQEMKEKQARIQKENAMLVSKIDELNARPRVVTGTTTIGALVVDMHQMPRIDHRNNTNMRHQKSLIAQHVQDERKRREYLKAQNKEQQQRIEAQVSSYAVVDTSLDRQTKLGFILGLDHRLGCKGLTQHSDSAQFQQEQRTLKESMESKVKFDALSQTIIMISNDDMKTCLKKQPPRRPPLSKRRSQRSGRNGRKQPHVCPDVASKPVATTSTSTNHVTIQSLVSHWLQASVQRVVSKSKFKSK